MSWTFEGLTADELRSAVDFARLRGWAPGARRPLRIVLLAGSSSPPYPADLEAPEIQRALGEDVVLHLFSPHAPMIMRAPEGTEVVEYRLGRWGDPRDGSRGRFAIRMDGSRDPIVCADQNARLLRDEYLPDDADWIVR